jgi:NDP-sugar pyrophosphorylase family protein
MKGLILAGGKGTRLLPLTLNTPKPIIPIANTPLLLYQIDLMRNAGIHEVILSLSYQPRKIEDLLQDGADYGISIRYAVEGTPLGTAGAFKSAESQIDSTTVVFNGNILASLDLASVIRKHKEHGAAATLVLTSVDNPSSYGLVETAPDGAVRRFIEKPEPNEISGRTINAGVYVLEPSVLSYIPKGELHSFERGLFPTLLERKERVLSFILDEYWTDISSPKKYLKVHHDILAGKFGSKRITANSPDRPALPADASIDDKSILDRDVVIRGGVLIRNSVIGRNCKVEEGVQIIDSVVWPGTTLDADSRVEGSIIGKGCYVGRSVNLQPGVVLGDKTVATDFSRL